MADIAQTPVKKKFFASLAETVGHRFPDLKNKLKLADMSEAPTHFLEKVLASTTFISASLIVLTYILLKDSILEFLKTNIMMLILVILAPLVIIPLIVFTYLMLYPDAMIARRRREIDYETAFAGKHIAIALKSGLPLFEAFVGASKGYGEVSKEFAKVVDKIVLGVPVTTAIKEVVEHNPSTYFMRIMLQMNNSIQSGADVGGSLESVLDQISKEQLISLREYSQKLTPIVMFYMVFGIIVPSLGIVLATVIFSAVSGGNFGLPPIALLGVFMIIALVQFLFVGMIESSRPKYLI